MGLLALAVLALSAACAHADTNEKQAEFERLAASSALVRLDDKNFDRLVRSEHRPYHTFVLFNAKDPQFNCDLCGPFEDEIEVLADSLQRQKAKDPSAPTAFIAVAEYFPNRNVFNGYNLQSVPMLVYFAPTGSSTHPKNKFAQGTQYSGEMDAENAANFFREKTDFRIQIYRSPWGKLFGLLFFLSAFSALIYTNRSRLGSILSWLQSPSALLLWFLGGLVFYYIAVSGALYNIIRDVPSVGFDPKLRKPVLISQQNGHQYRIEGFLIGALNVGAGTAVVMATKFLPKLKEQSQQVATIIIAVVVFGICYGGIYKLYQFKNQWY